MQACRRTALAAVVAALLASPAAAFSFIPALLQGQRPVHMPAGRLRSETLARGAPGGLQLAVMKRHVSKGAAQSDGAGPVADGKLLPKLGKLQDVTRQRRGDVLGARGAVKVQGKRWENLVQKPPTIRVSGGSAKGRKLKRPDVYLRPMMSKVKEALFSILVEFDVMRDDAIALDTFSGCGSVGIEALSRGVGQAVFVDYSKEACRTIEENLEACDLDSRSLVVCSKAESVYDAPESVLDRMKKRSFDLVTVTPPYEEIDYSDLLNRVATSESLLGDGAVLVVEYPVELGSLPPTIGSRLVGMRNRKYGRTMLGIYCVNPPVDIEPRPNEFGSLRYDYLEKGRLEQAVDASVQADVQPTEGFRKRRREGGRGTVGGRGGGTAGRH